MVSLEISFSLNLVSSLSSINLYEEKIKISARPGTIIELDKAGFTVVCGFGAVGIHTVQKSGGVKSPAAEYARAVGLRAGMNLDGGEP